MNIPPTAVKPNEVKKVIYFGTANSDVYTYLLFFITDIVFF